MHISHQKDERWSKYDEEAETVKRRLRREGNRKERDEELGEKGLERRGAEGEGGGKREVRGGEKDKEGRK